MRVQSHFSKSDPEVIATYQQVLKTARAFGPIVEEPMKTSIHLLRDTAFADVATRRSSLIVTLKSEVDIRSPRIQKREEISANRWHLEVRLARAADVDAQLASWPKAAHELAGR
jgi:hypothetical protein